VSPDFDLNKPTDSEYLQLHTESENNKRENVYPALKTDTVKIKTHYS
jgi:hypothetical protein